MKYVNVFLLDHEAWSARAEIHCVNEPLATDYQSINIYSQVRTLALPCHINPPMGAILLISLRVGDIGVLLSALQLKLD